VINFNRVFPKLQIEHLTGSCTEPFNCELTSILNGQREFEKRRISNFQGCILHLDFGSVIWHTVVKYLSTTIVHLYSRIKFHSNRKKNFMDGWTDVRIAKKLETETDKSPASSSLPVHLEKRRSPSTAFTADHRVPWGYRPAENWNRTYFIAYACIYNTTLRSFAVVL